MIVIAEKAFSADEAIFLIRIATSLKDFSGDPLLRTIFEI